MILILTCIFPLGFFSNIILFNFFWVILHDVFVPFGVIILVDFTTSHF
jgi:hypothetical protein